MKALQGGAGRVAALFLATLILGTLAGATQAAATPRWVSGDIHTHTYMTDGSNTQQEVLRNAFNNYGLDFFANSEHGGLSTYSPTGLKFTAPVWRWITLAHYSYPIVQDSREKYATKRIIQGVEWNAPTHEHVSVGIVGAANEPNGISDFEYLFDAADLDTSRANEGTPEVKDPATGDVIIPAMPFTKHNVTADDAIAGAQWLEDNYSLTSYLVVNHPSRKNAWSAADFRALNDAAPDVAFGMEGLPGHQAESARGGYGSLIKADGTTTTDPTAADSALTAEARTFGGADYFTAKVGGCWDSLLGEGRNWWIFNNSDYHQHEKQYKDSAGAVIGTAYYDFWPGEYARTWVRTKNGSMASLVAGMRSGNVWVANGDLINKLGFAASTSQGSATMGQTLKVAKNKTVMVTIRFKSPRLNEHGDAVKVNHVDLIGGDVTTPAVPGTPGYASETNPSTHVLKSFTKGSWKVIDGWTTMTIGVKAGGDSYLRLRGTNLAPNTLNETDVQGNPLNDDLAMVDVPKPSDPTQTVHISTPDQAWSDLWFYSNPIFIDVN